MVVLGKYIIKCISIIYIFNAVKWSYLQGMVIVPYLALAPTIVTGAITLGFVQQIIRAFGRSRNIFTIFS